MGAVPLFKVGDKVRVKPTAPVGGYFSPTSGRRTMSFSEDMVRYIGGTYIVRAVEFHNFGCLYRLLTPDDDSWAWTNEFIELVDQPVVNADATRYLKEAWED